MVFPQYQFDIGDDHLLHFLYVDYVQKNTPFSSFANLLLMTIDFKDVNKQVVNVKKVLDSALILFKQ